MDILEGIFYGLGLALTPELLLAALLGALAGTLVGVLPGLGPVAGAALILPFTFSYSPAVGLIMIAGIYCGSQYGGSTSAVLLNIPGEATSIPATFDGYAMTRKGRSGQALSIMAIGSFVASTLGLVVLVALAPSLFDLSLKFGPAEFFALTAGGLLLVARISGGSLSSGLFPMILGVMLGTVGLDASSGVARFTFGNFNAALGVSLVAIAIGMYGISEILALIEDPHRKSRPKSIRLRALLPSRDELRQALGPWGRGSAIGFLLGLLPMPSATLGAFTSYRVEKAISKHPEQFGTGAIPGIAGPEAANNGATIGSLVPVLVLGLPFSATLALMISAMQVQGINPGPQLATQHPDIFWGVIGAMYVANAMLLVLNLPLVGMWVSLLRVPTNYLIPGIMVVGAIGSFSENNNMIDLYFMLALGAVGYVLNKFDFSLASLLVGVILGPLIEKYALLTISLSHGDPVYFVSGIAGWIWGLVLLALVVVGLRTIQVRRQSRPTQTASDNSVDEYRG